MPSELQPLFILPTQGRSLAGPGDMTLQKLSANETADQLSLAEYVCEPGIGPPLHRHTREDETFWILDGEIAFFADGAVLTATAGSCVFAPRGKPHTFKNRTHRPARMLLIVTPPGNFEEFYAAFLEIVRRPLAPDEGMQQVIALGARHGIEILGPNPL